MPWLQLKTAMNIEVGGEIKRYKRHAWVEIKNKALADSWVKLGDARYAVPLQARIDLPGCGVVIVQGSHAFDAATNLQTALQSIDGLTVSICERAASIPYPRTLFIAPGTPYRPLLLPVGFEQLDHWQVAAPLCDYSGQNDRESERIYANRIGTPEAQERTKAVIRDLRVMVYDPRLLFVRRDDMTVELLRLWQDEMQTGDDSRLCFLRALYQVKPCILSLPYTWLVPHGRDEYDD